MHYFVFVVTQHLEVVGWGAHRPLLPIFLHSLNSCTGLGSQATLLKTWIVLLFVLLWNSVSSPGADQALHLTLIPFSHGDDSSLFEAITYFLQILCIQKWIPKWIHGLSPERTSLPWSNCSSRNISTFQNTQLLLVVTAAMERVVREQSLQKDCRPEQIESWS